MTDGQFYLYATCALVGYTALAIVWLTKTIAAYRKAKREYIQHMTSMDLD